MSTVVAPALPLPDAPYLGIESFGFVDQQIFAARERELWSLQSNITLYRSVLLYGESGTGKSSLINAGLLPEILKENYVADRIRVQPFAGREIRIERIKKSGGAHPTYLPSNFCLPPESGGSTPTTETESFELSLTAFRLQIARMRAAAWKAATSESQSLERPIFSDRQSAPTALLVFDQFEEFITLFEEAQRGGPTTEHRRRRQQAARVQRRILVTLIKLIRNPKLPVKIVFVFREDYLAKLELLFEHCPDLLDQAQRLLPPAVSDVPRIIRVPFTDPALRAHFLSSATESGSELGEELAQQIAKKLGRRSEGDVVNLTELQIVCLSLWKSSDPEKLFKRAGIEGLLKDYGAAVLRELKPELHGAAAILLSHMITGQNTRNIISEPDLLARSSQHRDPATPEQLREALETLCRRQLARRESRRNIYVYELVSEYFVPWINELVGKRKALELTLEARETRQRLADQRLRAWRELRRARLLRNLLIACGALLVIVVALGGITAYFYRRSVSAQREIANSQLKSEIVARQNERYKTAIKAIGGKNDAEKLEAITQIKKWSEEDDFPAELLLLVAAAQSGNPEIKRISSELVARAAQNNPNLSQSIGTAVTSNATLAERLPPTFYIHIADETQRVQAQKVASALRQRGWVVPGIQNVGDGGPLWNNELRYFRKEEEGRPAIPDILEVLKSTTGSSWADGYNSRYENSPKIRPGQLEIWFARPKGQLTVSFIDEEGMILRGATLFFEPTGERGTRFTSRAKYIAVPPGEYQVRITLTGYPELQRPLSIEAYDQVDWSNLKLIKVRFDQKTRLTHIQKAG